MKKITINLSLTKAQWALLSLGIKYIVPLLPRMSWDELEEIDKLIDKKLEAVQTDEFVEKQLEKQKIIGMIISMKLLKKLRRIPMPKFRVIVNETNTVVYEIEANDEDHASDLIHEDIMKYEDKITSESVTDWDVDFVEEIS